MGTNATASPEGPATFLVSSDGVARTNAVGGPLDGKAEHVDHQQDRALAHHWLSISEMGEEAENRKGTELLGIARRLLADAITTLPNGSAHRARPIDVPANMIAMDAFSRVVLNCLAQISANAQLVRSGSNREALHQTRIGLRRLRAAFSAFKAILPVDGLEKWKKEAEWLAAELDSARDFEVFAGRIPLANRKRPREPTLGTLFGGRLLIMQAGAYESALGAIESPRFAVFLDGCSEWAGPAAWQPAERAEMASLREGPSSLLAAQSLRRLHHRLRKAAARLEDLDPAGRHEARVIAKNLRYAAEFFFKTFDKSGKKNRVRYVTSLSVLQDTLGELNDLAMIRRCACTLAGSNAELAFQAGQIVGNQKKEQTRLLAKAARSYSRWLKVKPRGFEAPA